MRAKSLLLSNQSYMAKNNNWNWVKCGNWKQVGPTTFKQIYWTLIMS